MKPRRLRVLHCPNTVAGNPQSLARAERAAGLESWSVSFHRSPYGYSSDEILWKDRNRYLVREMRRWGLLRRALRDFDVVHFNFGSSILPHWIPAESLCENGKPPILARIYNLYATVFELRDLPLLKRAGKVIAVTYQGDDARQGDYCLSHFETTFAREVDAGYYTPAGDRRKRRNIAVFSRYADLVYALNPDLLHVLPAAARFMPYAHVDLSEWTPSPMDKPPGARPLVVHAPSDQKVKGTRYILDAVSRLRSEGVSFDFVLVESMSNEAARRIYEKADLLVDQLLAGWYGGVAVEFMALGKPVVCYLRESDLRFLPEAMRRQIPIIRAESFSLHSVLKEWLTVRRHDLGEVGMQSRAYVEAWHDPARISRDLKRDYESSLSQKTR